MLAHLFDGKDLLKSPSFPLNDCLSIESTNVTNRSSTILEKSCDTSNDTSLSLSSIFGTGESGSGGILDLDNRAANVLRRAGDTNLDANDSCRIDPVGDDNDTDTDPGAVGGRCVYDDGVVDMVVGEAVM